MCDDKRDENKCCKTKNIECTGSLWAIGWLFTIGFAKITGWKLLFSLILWPYYLGSVLSK
ncbi:MAG: hypothetical protein ISR90_00835 [Candidatus Marinimicrobia bacterium]|nr:hypothetical protein [Candidatus Neomarinimicrobiota bacterium]MBL7022589.1 hypothetical protein [Candidatus Neomarinimicrobiota bacterium]MBL7108945.1 hypothetical protein [Candidatus Neomarinimicrobiota bacterium]